MTAIPGVAAFTLGAGFSQNITSLVVCRFFAGLFASPGLSIGTAMYSDFFLPEQRGGPVATLVTTVQMGTADGEKQICPRLNVDCYRSCLRPHRRRLRHRVQKLALDAMDDSLRARRGLCHDLFHVGVLQTSSSPKTRQANGSFTTTGAAEVSDAIGKIFCDADRLPAHRHDVHRADCAVFRHIQRFQLWAIECLFRGLLLGVSRNLLS